MDIGMVGLGRMGANMAQRLIGGGHRVVVSDLNADAVGASAKAGAEPDERRHLGSERRLLPHGWRQ
jgi:6-phosphogluconate dehydrogenase